MPKPSFGCSTCRSRRVKCDERDGGCLNCERYGVVCPGYQHEFDVLLRFHTAPGQDVPQRGERSAAPAIARPPTPDVDQLALAMFYSNQCVDGSTNWPLEHIRAEGNGCLFAAIKTLSSIDMSREWSLSGGSDITHVTYVAAIQLLNAAIGDPTESVRDSTLMATMLMSTIEMKAAPSQDSSYWEAHTTGAAALLQLRGATQVMSTVGAALYFQVSSMLLTTCMLARRRVPAELADLREAVRPFLNDESSPVWRHQGAIIRVTEYVAQLAEENIVDVTDRIREAYNIYEELVSVFSSANPVWQYRTVPSERIPDLLDYEHIYQSVLATQLWNSHRAAVILLCTNVADLVQDLNEEATLAGKAQDFWRTVPQLLNQTAIETLAAVPQAVDRIDYQQRSSSVSGDPNNICHKGHTYHDPVFRIEQPQTTVMPYLHGCQIQWAIVFAVQSSTIALDIRRQLWEILDEAGNRLQIKQWQDLAARTRRELWLFER